MNGYLFYLKFYEYFSTMSNYSPNEFQAIIKLATELDKQENSNELVNSFSLKEIHEIAVSSGISEQSLEKALKIIQQRGSSPEIIPNKIAVRDFISTEIDEEAWELIVRKLQAHFKQPGSASELKTKYEWSAVLRRNGYVHVSVSKNESISEIQILADHSSIETRLKLSASAFGFAVFAMMSSYLNLDVYTNFLPLAVNLLGGGIGFFLSSFGIRTFRKRRAETYHALIRKLCNKLSKTPTKVTPSIQLNLGQPLEHQTKAIKLKER